jgi:hypothetical protein
MSKLTKHGMMHKKQRKQNKMSSILKGLQLNELSNTKLGDYKKAAGADATAADKEGDYKRGDKRMSGIIKATKKEFANDAKKLKEFAPVGGDDREPDEEEILRQLAAKWWLGTEQEMSKAQKTLAAMGWDIGQDESGDDDAGVFVIRVGDENGDSYIAFNHSDLEELNEAFNNYHANRTGFTRGARDDERHDLDTPAQVWGLKINGKVWSKGGKDVTFTSKQAALNTRNAILKNRPDLEIGLITKGGSPASGAQSKTDDNFRAYLAQRKAGEQLDEIIDPSTALAKALRYVGRKFAQTFPLLAVGGVGAGLAASGLMAPIVASMGGISTALSALSAEMAFSAGMAGTYAAPSIIQTIKDLFAADENSIQAGIKRWVEKYVGDDNDVQEFMLVHSKAAYEGKPGFRWRAKQWPVKMTREQAEAYLEKNDKSWLDFEKQKAADAEKASKEQGTADMSNIQKPMNEGVPSDNDMGVVPDARSGTSTKMTLGQWKQMWLKKMPHADQGMFRYPPAMKGSFIAYFDGWENTPGARWDPQQSVSEEQLDELSCWSGYHRVAGTKAGFPGSCAKNKTNEEGVAAGIPTSSLTSRYMDDPNHPSYKSTTSPKKEKTLQDILKDNDFAALQIWARNNSNNPLVKGASAAGDAAANNIKQQLGLAGKMSYEIPAGVMMDKINPVTTKAMFDYLRTHAQQGVAEAQHSKSCPHCGGEMVSEELMNEKKDACYYKVKSRYKVWPSAYASGALVKCRNKGAKNWGNGGKKNESSILEGINRVDESLHDWFNKEKWVRMDTKGNIKGPCAKEPGEGKPKCLPQAKAHSLGKKGRASAAQRKRREDPNPDRTGKAINVNTKKQSNENIDEDWKKKFGAAALTGAMALGAAGASADTRRVTPDGQGGFTGGMKPSATVVAPDNTPSATPPTSDTSDPFKGLARAERADRQAQTITVGGKEYRMVEISPTDIRPRSGKQIVVPQAVLGERSIGNYMGILTGNTVFVISK